MKKVTLLVSVLFITFAAWADPVIKGTSVITLSCAGEPDAQVSFLISTSFSDAYDNTWDAEAANPGGIYVYSGGERYTTWASNGYTAGLKIGFASVAGKTNYTLKFSNWDGVSYDLYDYETGTVINVNSGSVGDYEFTATAGTTFNDRFALNLSIPSGNLTTCFTGTELQITNNPIFGKIVVKRKSDGVKVHEYSFGTTSITMNTSTGYSDGDYIVEFGSGTSGQRSFVVTVKN